MAIAYEVRDAVAVLTLNRPEALNALDVETLRELRARLAGFQDDPQLRCLVLTGAGGRAFCTGADLKATRTSAASYAEAMFNTKSAAGERGLYIRLMDLTDLNIWKPMVAAINGHCLGGGLELALQCDVRIASENATLGLPEVSVGTIPGVAGVHRLIKAVGTSHAMQMALGGERIKAERAAAIGLVSEVVPQKDLLPRALEIATRIAGNAPLAVQAVKKLARTTGHLTEAEAQELTELHWAALRDSADRIEGRTAFAEKRPPRYTGR